MLSERIINPNTNAKKLRRLGVEPSLESLLFSQSKSPMLNHEYYPILNPNPMKLPIRYHHHPVHLSLRKDGIDLQLDGKQYYFIINPKVMWLLAITLLFYIAQPLWTSEQQVVYIERPNSAGMMTASHATLPSGMEESEIFYALSSNTNFEREESLENSFLVQKQLVVTKFLIDEKVARVDQLPNESLLALNKEISDLFIYSVLNHIDIEPHVYQFLTDSLPLRKIETSLMEQAKFNIPASIKLAQAALETAYGKYVKNNNFFGIKASAAEGAWVNTLEYYSPEELKRNESKVISKQKMKIGGKTIYKCRVRDTFSTYESAWHSFRAHSLHLSKQNRYAPLFTNGKDYRAWAEKIGSSKHGGLGYATQPNYGDLLSKIIERYHLHLLDY